MAVLTVLGSSSQGNSYILECGEEVLILEIGLSWKKILEGLDYNLQRKVFAIASHEHGDHICESGLAGCLKFQIPVFSTPSAAAKHKGVRPLKDGKWYAIGSFVVCPLKVPHGDCECYAYIIKHPEFGKMVFATDLSRFPYKVQGVQHILMECNNSEDVILENMANNRFSPSRVEDHLSYDRAVRAIDRMQSPALVNVMLLHLSASNADPDRFQRDMLNQIGITPIIATQGVRLSLAPDDF